MFSCNSVNSQPSIIPRLGIQLSAAVFVISAIAIGIIFIVNMQTVGAWLTAKTLTPLVLCSSVSVISLAALPVFTFLYYQNPRRYRPQYNPNTWGCGDSLNSIFARQELIRGIRKDTTPEDFFLKCSRFPRYELGLCHSMVKFNAVTMAVFQANLVLLQALIECAPALVDVEDWNGRSPLACAYMHTDSKAGSEMAEFLIQNGANINSNGLTPLFQAIQWRDDKHVQFLLRRGAKLTGDPSAQCGLDSAGWEYIVAQTKVFAFTEAWAKGRDFLGGTKDFLYDTQALIFEKLWLSLVPKFYEADV